MPRGAGLHHDHHRGRRHHQHPQRRGRPPGRRKPGARRAAAPPGAIDNTIVVVGSHDNTLDLLADQLKRDAPHVSLSSSHVGSMGGLMALRKGVCHVAGTHLLDTDTGEYNSSAISASTLPGRGCPPGPAGAPRPGAHRSQGQSQGHPPGSPISPGRTSS
jgi:hypothetical protein